MNVLITGASGFIGTALTERLLRKGHHLTCQSRHAHVDSSNVQWLQYDLCKDPLERLSLPSVEVVFHLAAQTSTYSAKQDPIGDLSANVFGFLTLLEYFRRQEQSPFVVLAGTVTEVGLTPHLPIHEALPDHPITFYDISKLTAEMYLKQYIREGWVTGCCLRFANVFGRREATQQADRGILDKIFSRALTGQNITIYGDGSYLRDYIFIDDVVSALEVAPQFPEQTNGRTFCIGTGVGTTLKEAFLKVSALATCITGVQVEHFYVVPPSELSDIEFRHAVIDSSAFREATGWSPQYDFETGLQAAYQSFLMNPAHAHHS
jgi:nucleoside-diphosphate-sugar epimerase